MRNRSSRLLLVVMVLSALLGGCATPGGKIAAAFCDGLTLGACTQTGPFFDNDMAPGGVARGTGLTRIEDMPCPIDRSITNAELTEKLKDKINASCAFEKIRRYS